MFRRLYLGRDGRLEPNQQIINKPQGDFFSSNRGVLAKESELDSHDKEGI